MDRFTSKLFLEAILEASEVERISSTFPLSKTFKKYYDENSVKRIKRENTKSELIVARSARCSMMQPTLNILAIKKN